MSDWPNTLKQWNSVNSEIIAYVVELEGEVERVRKVCASYGLGLSSKQSREGSDQVSG